MLVQLVDNEKKKLADVPYVYQNDVLVMYLFFYLQERERQKTNKQKC